MKNIEQIVESAYKLYMPQIREEILAFAWFVHTFGVRNMMEIGTAYGGTLKVWCELCEGKRISVDLVGGIHGGIDRQATDIRNKFFQETYEGVYLIDGDSHKEDTKHRVREVLDGELVELLFIDGDHTYEGVTADYQMYKEFVAPGGIIAFHDINDTPHHRALNAFVSVLWRELEGIKIEFNQHQQWAGIGAIVTEGWQNHKKRGTINLNPC
jgi:cephalosporin hydroxylase